MPCRYLHLQNKNALRYLHLQKKPRTDKTIHAVSFRSDIQSVSCESEPPWRVSKYSWEPAKQFH